MPQDQTDISASQPNSIKFTLPISGQPGRPEQAIGPASKIDGNTSLEPTRYGDWEKNGRCIDF